MSASTQILRANGKLTLLASLTVGHGINDFYSVLLPVLLPVIAADFGLNYTQFGFVFLITTVTSGVAQPLLGFIADRYGLQKHVLLTGFTLFALGLAGFSVATTFLALIVSSLVYGFGQTTFHPQSTNYITETFAANKGKAMGVHGLGGSLGNFLAPISAALLITAFGWRHAAVVLAVSAILSIAILSTNIQNKNPNYQVSLAGGLTRDLLVLGINFGLITMFYSGFLAFLPAWLLENDMALTSAGAITSLMLAVGVISQPLGGAIFDRFGGWVIFFISPIVAGTALFILTGAEGWLVTILIVLVGASVAMTFPVALTMASSLTSVAGSGMSIGIVFGISTTMSSFTPLLTGLLADQYGLSTSLQLLAVLPVLAICMTIFMLPRNRERT